MKQILSGVVILALGAPFFAGAAAERVPATVGPSGTAVTIPARAVEVAPNAFSLGESIDAESGTKVEGYMIVHKAKENNAQSSQGNARVPKSTCYGFMASGAKWKTVEPWVVNPANTYGIANLTVFSILDSAIALWENAADDGVIDGSSMNILGAGSQSSSSLSMDTGAPDNMNEVYFGDLDATTIGVTLVWGVFSGPTQNRRLVEWDQVYNTDFDWATDGSPTAMDFQNIATHELGHTFGLADLYTSGCTEETMYGYGTEGETKKRSLNTGDLKGISTLY